MERMCKVNQRTGMVEGKSVLAKRNSVCKTWREKLAKKTSKLSRAGTRARRGRQELNGGQTVYRV